MSPSIGSSKTTRLTKEQTYGRPSEEPRLLRAHVVEEPSLTIVAITAIGLGIGANTAIFSVVNTVLLQPLPFPQPKQLVNIASEQRNQTLDGRGTFSVPDFLDVQKSSTTLQYVATFQGSGTFTTDGNEPERLLGAAANTRRSDRRVEKRMKT